jgi:exopolysaccharide biosynthesis polyprenyl glycosylphosphotransferase
VASTVQEAAAVRVRTLQPLEVPSDLECSRAPSSGRTWAGLQARLRERPWPLPVLDFVALAAADACALAWSRSDGAWLPMAAFPLLGVLVLCLRGAYAPRLRIVMLDSCGLAIGSVSAAAMCTLAIGLMVRSGDPGSALLFRGWLLGAAFLAIHRILYTLEQQHLRASGVTARRTVIVGAGEVGARVGRRLEESPSYGLIPLGFLDADPPPSEAVGGRRAPVLGPPSALTGLIESRGVEHVILAFCGVSDRELLPLVQRCSASGVPVSVVPRLFDSINNRMAYEPVGGLPLATLRSTNPLGPTFAVKHAFDRIGAVLLVAFLAPMLAVVGLLVKLSSPGPVLFRQRRVRRDGQVFDMLKFRTMVQGDPEPDFVLPAGLAPGGVEGADRRTPIGRWLRRTSLDELPQLFNVLRGEMSLVGPRPERPEFVEGFTAELARYSERHRVRSGITGWSQVQGLRGRCSIADRVELDNYYIENWSLGMDIKILLMTVVAVMRPAQ